MKYILSIDGGGIRGLIPIYFLRCLEADIGPIRDKFDMFGGCSVGAIIAAAIVYSEYDTVEKLSTEVFTDERLVKIFTKNRGIGLGLRPKYSGKYKKDIIHEVLANKKITDTDKHVLIPVYELFSKSPRFYKSYTLGTETKSETYNKTNKNLKLAGIVDASSAAPSYFPSVEYDSDTENRSGIDGAVFCNCPSDALYADALALWPDEPITIISIGTGSVVPKPLKNTKKWGLVQWAFSGITDIILSNDTVSDYKTRHYANALGHKYIRIQSPVDIKLDDTARIEDLKKIGVDWYQTNKKEILDCL